jgi:hypothetical protein
MQTSSIRFMGKVLIASGIVAVGIKEMGPQLDVPATPAIVMGLVLLPTVFVGLALLLQYRLQRH